jgi:flagellar biosynthetic protein FliR
MTQATLTQLTSQIAGHNVIGFFLVLARISPLFVVAPLFSSAMVPPRVRGIIAVAVAMGLTGVATHGQKIPSQPLQVFALIVENMLVGFGFAFTVSLVLAAVQAAGAFTDALAGFSFGSMIDPVNGNQGGVLTELYGLVGVMMFIAIGGDAWTLRGIARTFTLVPVTRGPQIASLVGGVDQIFGTIFTSALEVAAPAMLALLITDVSFGMVSRVVPQLNVFAVGFPLKVGVSLLVVGATLPFLGGWMTNQIQDSVGTALHTLQIG